MWLLLYVPAVQQAFNRAKPQLVSSLCCTPGHPEQNVPFTDVSMEGPLAS